jgi:hypothetical protein
MVWMNLGDLPTMERFTNNHWDHYHWVIWDLPTMNWDSWENEYRLVVFRPPKENMSGSFLSDSHPIHFHG